VFRLVRRRQVRHVPAELQRGCRAVGRHDFAAHVVCVLRRADGGGARQQRHAHREVLRRALLVCRRLRRQSHRAAQRAGLLRRQSLQHCGRCDLRHPAVLFLRSQSRQKVLPGQRKEAVFSFFFVSSAFQKDPNVDCGLGPGGGGPGLSPGVIAGIVVGLLQFDLGWFVWLKLSRLPAWRCADHLSDCVHCAQTQKTIFQDLNEHTFSFQQRKQQQDQHDGQRRHHSRRSAKHALDAQILTTQLRNPSNVSCNTRQTTKRRETTR
jgi:hypothetical protein